MPENPPAIKFKRLNENALLPKYANPDDAGFDLYAPSSGIINSRKRKLIPLEIASEIPKGWFVLVKDKSGLSDKVGITVLAGVIDSSYRGEWKVVLLNTGETPFTYEEGDKIAQGILLWAPQAKILEVKELSKSERGTGGFGSTGVK